MTQLRELPVLFAADTVALPGMVVPIELDDAARAAIDAARTAHADVLPSLRSPGDDRPAEVLLAPRLGDTYPTHGVIATIDRAAGDFAR